MHHGLRQIFVYFSFVAGGAGPTNHSAEQANRGYPIRSRNLCKSFKSAKHSGNLKDIEVMRSLYPQSRTEFRNCSLTNFFPSGSVVHVTVFVAMCGLIIRLAASLARPTIRAPPKNSNREKFWISSFSSFLGEGDFNPSTVHFHKRTNRVDYFYCGFSLLFISHFSQSR